MSETVLNKACKIVWVGRFTGPKGEFALQLLRDVVPQFPECQFTFVGGPLADHIVRSTPDNVTFSDFVSDVNAVYNAHDLVIGAGRVVIEAMRLQKPVIAVGESEYIGLINPDNINRALETNFGDCAASRDFNIKQLIHDLRQFIDQGMTINTSSYAWMLREFEPDYVHQQVDSVYRKSMLSRYLKQFKELPVLMYHRVVTAPVTDSKFKIFITRDELDAQLANLKRRGFTAITFADLLKGNFPDKPVMLTFDDGYQDNHDNLLPLLEKHNMKATVFVLANRKLTNNEWDIPKGEPEAQLMDDAAITACHNSGLIEIGSHGLNHLHLPDVSKTELHDEVVRSKSALENIIGDSVNAFAYPYGDYTAREVGQVREAGYAFGIGTVNGPLNFADDLFRIRRINMFANTSRSGFWKKTSGSYLRYCKLKGKDF